MSFPNYRKPKTKTSTASIRVAEYFAWLSRGFDVELDLHPPDFSGLANDGYEHYTCGCETHAYLFAAFVALVLEDEGYTVELPV